MKLKKELLRLNEITLREATIEDFDDLYRWRNDPLTREQSFNNKEILYEEHCRWFEKAIKEPNKLFYIGIDDKNEKCGVVRFDMRGEFFAEINVNVAPQKRGKGIGSELISRSCTLLFSMMARKLILARTKEGNIASIKAFKKAGFSELFRYNDTTGGVIVLILFSFGPIWRNGR